MKYTRLYTATDGETHFEDVEITLTGGEAPFGVSDLIGLSGMQFRRSQGEYPVAWHPAPRRQWVIILTGATEVTASDGETRRFEAGSIILIEDTTGKGHLTRSIDTTEGDRWSLFIHAT